MRLALGKPPSSRMIMPGLGVSWVTDAWRFWIAKPSPGREDVVGAGPNVAGDEDINAEGEDADDAGALDCV